MKGLIFRELYLGRKKIFLVALIWFLFVAMGILMRLSMLYGNMAHRPEEDLASVEPVLFYTMVYASVAVLMFSNEALSHNISSDYSTKWTLFGCSSPVSEYKYVGAKFLLTVMFSCIAFLLSLANATVMCSLSDRAFDGNVIYNIFALIMLTMTAFSAVYALFYKLRSHKKMNIILGGTFAISYLSAMGVVFVFLNKLNQLYPNATDEEKYKLLNDYLNSLCVKANELYTGAKPFLPLIFISVIAAMYFLCVKALKRRED